MSSAEQEEISFNRFITAAIDEGGRVTETRLSPEFLVLRAAYRLYRLTKSEAPPIVLVNARRILQNRIQDLPHFVDIELPDPE